MDISKLIGDTTPFSMDWKGEEVTWEAQTESLTPNMIASLKSPGEYAAAICSVVRTWNLTDGEEAWPLTEEAVGKLPVAFLSAMLDKIGESWSGDDAKKKPSVNGSVATAK